MGDPFPALDRVQRTGAGCRQKVLHDAPIWLSVPCLDKGEQGNHAHKPDETFEVDWVGKTVPIYDSVTGEAAPAYIFVGMLSCSGYIYAELCRDMRSESFIACHVHAYEYFGLFSKSW